MTDSPATTPTTRLAGAREAFDLYVNPESFEFVRKVLEDSPDIAWIDPVRRKNRSALINHPDFVGRVLAKNYRNYRKGPGFEQVKMLLGNGIIVSDGDFWLNHRRMVQPAFHRSLLASLAPLIEESIAALAVRWQAAADTGENINLTQDVSDLSLDIISRILFGEDLDAMSVNGGENPFAFLSEDRSRDLQTVVRFRALTKLIQKVIDARRSGVKRRDMTAAMMAASHPETGDPMPDDELIDEITTLIVAGHETTASAMNWMWYLISQDLNVERKVHEEVDRLPVERPGFEHLADLGYAKQVASETLRLYPPVWMYSRKAVAADRLGDYDIPAGTNIFLAPYFLHRREECWPRAEEFAPSRFSPEEVAGRHPFAYIPFSAGPRKCIGDGVSLIEMQLLIGCVARRVKLRYAGDAPPPISPAINLRSENHLFFTAERR